MLIYAYKEKRVWAKAADVTWEKLQRAKAITEEPLTPSAVPTHNELRRMMEDDRDDRD